MFIEQHISILSPIRMVIVSHMDVCKNTFTYHLSYKTHGFGRRFKPGIHCAISVRFQQGINSYEKIACDVKQKLTIYVLTLYGPIVEHDLCAHTMRVKYSG